MNDNLQTPNNYRPIPKAHLFLHKLRKINTIDREIRQKWLQLQKKKIQQQQHSLNQVIQIQKMRQRVENQLPHFRLETSPNKIMRIRSDIIREEASLRKKLYDDIYYKKNKRDHSPTLISVNLGKNSANRYTSQSRVKTEQDQESPLLLRKRTKTMQKELNIIRNRYENSLNQLHYRKNKEELKCWESQKRLIRKFQGKKFYYQLANSWQPST